MSNKGEINAKESAEEFQVKGIRNRRKEQEGPGKENGEETSQKTLSLFS